MNWKKAFKKRTNDFSKNIFDFSVEESSIILWKRSEISPGDVSLDFLKNEINFYREEIRNYIISLDDNFYLNKFTFVFSSLGISEYFDTYLSYSNFENTFEYFKKQNDSYTALVVINMISKWNYYTNIKFSKIYNLTFPHGKEISMITKKRIFEVMKETTLESINKMLNYVNEILQDFSAIDPYKNFLLIEEIMDLGEEHTWHWSKMMDQVIDVAISSFYSDHSQEEPEENDTISFESSFEDFYEKTKTMVIQDELDEAFKYFGINFSTEQSEFKKIYRRFAKKYHPDVNKELNAQIEMKKVNVYKAIIEEYFNN